MSFRHSSKNSCAWLFLFGFVGVLAFLGFFQLGEGDYSVYSMLGTCLLFEWCFGGLITVLWFSGLSVARLRTLRRRLTTLRR
jgi:hypothetical protein